MHILKNALAIVLLWSLVEAMKKKKKSNVELVFHNSEMENEIIASFKNEGFEEIDMEEKERKAFPFKYKSKGKDPILKAYLIVPKHTYTNGTEEYFQEDRDFRIKVSKKTLTFESRRVGYFHLSVERQQKGKGKSKQLQTIIRINVILNAGMIEACEDVSCGDTCNKASTRDTIDCPVNNECNIITDDASKWRDKLTGRVYSQPIGDAVLVATCDVFIDTVINKFNTKGGKVDINLDAHGFNGGFVIGHFEGPEDIVRKGSDCYNKICRQLKDKIKTLTLFACSTAGGIDGPPFLKCLANCLNARVRGWKKILYIRALWNSDSVDGNVWSTATNFTEPLDVTPCPSSTTTPSLIIAPTLTPTPTPTTPPPTTAHTTEELTTTDTTEELTTANLTEQSTTTNTTEGPTMTHTYSEGTTEEPTTYTNYTM